ncbi:MAG: pantetheine-phosphate adenylyltransferase [Clostridia bacterium]|nr:pantetheine-phosphate adenylyltransferase [Clostridia bacterium]
MEKKKIALFPGSFDPVTEGHIDVAKRALKLFDRVIVAICVNEAKSGFFTPEKRLKLAKAAFDGIAEVVICRGIVAEFAKEVGADALVRGARTAADFEYELGLCEINRRFSGIDTVVFPTRPEFLHISSSYAHELIRYNMPLSGVIPEGAAELIYKEV